MMSEKVPSAVGGDAGALSALREATRAEHSRLEGLFGLRGSFTLRQYGAALRALAGFVQAWEPILLAALPARLHVWSEPGAQLAQLRHDLHVLGAHGAPPRPAMTLALPDEACALGSLYVMEGSALGGQLIARSAREQHGLAPGRGASYFSGRGDATGERWRRFRALLADELTDEPARLRACMAARDTFNALADRIQLEYGDAAGA